MKKKICVKDNNSQMFVADVNCERAKQQGQMKKILQVKESQVAMDEANVPEGDEKIVLTVVDFEERKFGDQIKKKLQVDDSQVALDTYLEDDRSQEVLQMLEEEEKLGIKRKRMNLSMRIFSKLLR